MKNILFVDDDLKQLVCRIRTLPSPPTLYVELLAALRSGEPSMDRIGEIVARDPDMSAKILQLVNSAFFGLGHHIAHPTEAATCLGVETVKSLVLSTQLFAQFSRCQARVPEFPFEALWQHCWNTGVRARRNARAERLDAETTDHCFASALLHDVGKLILAASLPDVFQQALARSRRNQMPLWQAEKELFGSSHAEIGAYLLGLWSFPNPVMEAVALHHRPGGGLKPGLDIPTIVRAANALDHDLSQPARPGQATHLDLDYLSLVRAESHLEAWFHLCLTAAPSKV